MTMYRILDHAHGFKVRDYPSAFEAQDAALRLARKEVFCSNRRVHISVIGARGRQIMDISISQREEVGQA